MKHSIISRALILGGIALCPVATPACSNAPAGPSSHESTDATGTFSLPLTTVANGNTYRLSAMIYLYGPTFQVLSTNDQDPTEAQLSANLQTGFYSAYLTTFSLEKIDATGDFVPVPATLVSSSYSDFTVYDGTTTTITYRFQTDGVIVTVGAGDLRVDVEVEETGAACTPLGTDCPAGMWCPPSELTGASPACVSEGAMAIGEPCSGVMDCAANTTCVDLGTVPACAALCSGSAFDLPCDSGGICQPAGSEYGVCHP